LGRLFLGETGGFVWDNSLPEGGVTGWWVGGCSWWVSGGCGVEHPVGLGSLVRSRTRFFASSAWFLPLKPEIVLFVRDFLAVIDAADEE
jgi:hypothetical protein